MSGKIITVASVAGTAPSADGGYAHYGAAKAAIAHYTPVSGAGSRAVWDHGELHRPGVIATERIMATVIPGSVRAIATGPSWWRHPAQTSFTWPVHKIRCQRGAKWNTIGVQIGCDQGYKIRRIAGYPGGEGVRHDNSNINDLDGKS
jgi:hypothetical protein